jgi:hypothetical protein
LGDGRAIRNTSGKPPKDFEDMRVRSENDNGEKGGNVKNAQLKKTLLKFKKSKKIPTSKGGMNTVKIDF